MGSDNHLAFKADCISCAQVECVIHSSAMMKSASKLLFFGLKLCIWCFTFFFFLQLMWTIHPDVNKWGKTSLWCWKKNFDKPNNWNSLVWWRSADQSCEFLLGAHSFLRHFDKLSETLPERKFENVSPCYLWPSAEWTTPFSSRHLLQNKAQHQAALGTVNEESAPMARSITLTWHRC